MKTYDLGEHCIGRDEEDYNNIFLGRPLRYNPFDLDYEINIKPYLIKCRMENILDLLDDCLLVDINHVCSMITEWFKPILEQALNMTYPSELEIKMLEKASEDKDAALDLFQTKYDLGGFSGWFSGLLIGKMAGVVEGSLNNLLVNSKNEQIDIFENDETLNNVISTLALFTLFDSPVQFKDNIPNDMEELIKKFATIPAKLVANVYDIDSPFGELTIDFREKPLSAGICLLGDTHAAYKIKDTPGARITKGMLILNGFEFKTKNDAKTLHHIMNFDDKELLLGVCFQDCNFNGNDCSFSDVHGHLIFQSCHFDKKIRACLLLNGSIEFDNCTFDGDLDLSNIQMDNVSSIRILDCFFNKGCKLDLSEIHFGRGGKLRSITINNTQIAGDFDMSGIRTPLWFNFKDVYFMGSVKSKGTKFQDTSTFENIGFPTQYSTEIDKSRKELYDSLKDSGLEDKAKELDLVVENKPKKSGKIDMDAYQAAYATGYLNPDYAAFLLGKSSSYLAKKRVKDRKTITRDSIPFIVSGRDVQYPVEVLLAFKSHDWSTLKELRQKYPIPNDMD